jgi:hypothetical protein
LVKCHSKSDGTTNEARVESVKLLGFFDPVIRLASGGAGW